MEGCVCDGQLLAKRGAYVADATPPQCVAAGGGCGMECVRAEWQRLQRECPSSFSSRRQSGGGDRGVWMGGCVCDDQLLAKRGAYVAGATPPRCVTGV